MRWQNSIKSSRADSHLQGVADDVVNPTASSWRWGRLQPLKSRRNFTLWRGCLPENMLLTSVKCYLILVPNLQCQFPSRIIKQRLKFRYRHVVVFINLLAPEFYIQILAHPVCKIWIIHEPIKVALWNKRHFEEKNRESAACLKYSVLTFVEKIYIKCNIWRVAVRPSYI